MLTKRDLIAGFAISGAASILSSVNSPVFAQDSLPAPPDFSLPPMQWPTGQPVPLMADYIVQIESWTGKQAPYRAEVELAEKLVTDIPNNKAPHEIAFRFHEWRKGKVGASPEEVKRYSYYAREWPIRGNPVIMGFFDATGLRTPAGDTTFWCAAFVSWCIQRRLQGANIKEKQWPYEKGAASAAYRDWGQDVERDLKDKPQRGDLVVFKNKKSSWAGHVGFYYGMDGSRILVLGGNQGAQNEHNGGEVNIAPFARSSNVLEFHSFRRHKALS